MTAEELELIEQEVAQIYEDTVEEGRWERQLEELHQASPEEFDEKLMEFLGLEDEQEPSGGGTSRAASSLPATRAPLT